MSSTIVQIILPLSPGRNAHQLLLPTAVLKTLHKCGGWDSDLDSLLAISELSSALFVFLSAVWSVFSVIAYDLWWRHSFLTLGAALHSKNPLVIARFHDAIHTDKTSSASSSKATLNHLWPSTTSDWRDRALFFEGWCVLPESSNVVSSVHSKSYQRECGFDP